MRIRVSKRASITGGLPARDMADHVPGHQQPEGFSLPLEYTVEGKCTALPSVGMPFAMMRFSRNGVPSLGLFQTTPVVEVTDKEFRTQNSVYEYSVLTSTPEPV